jgi:hypothetical protein
MTGKTPLSYFLIAAFLLPLATTVYAQSNGPPPGPRAGSQHNQSQSENNAQKPDYREYVSGSPTIQIDRNIDARKGKQGPEESAAQSNNRPAYNWGIWVFTGVIAIFSIVQAGALIYQYRAMRDQVSRLQKTVEATEKLWKAAENQREDLKASVDAAVRSADATEKAAEATRKTAEALPTVERAYLFIDIDIVTIDPQVFIEIRLQLKNEGKTPAIITGIWAGLIKGIICPGKEDKTRFFLVEGNHVVAAQGTHKQVLRLDYRHVIQPGSIGEQNPSLIFFGWVKYDDVFKTAHTVNFCWHHDPQAGAAGVSFRRCYNPKSNDYT